jgi:hypothetical protein
MYIDPIYPDKASDKRLVHVADEKRRLMREHSDLIFEGADQALIDAKWKEWKEMIQLDKEGVTLMTKF